MPTLAAIPTALPPACRCRERALRGQLAPGAPNRDGAAQAKTGSFSPLADLVPMHRAGGERGARTARRSGRSDLSSRLSRSDRLLAGKMPMGEPTSMAANPAIASVSAAPRPLASRMRAVASEVASQVPDERDRRGVFPGSSEWRLRMGGCEFSEKSNCSYPRSHPRAATGRAMNRLETPCNVVVPGDPDRGPRRSIGHSIGLRLLGGRKQAGLRLPRSSEPALPWAARVSCDGVTGWRMTRAPYGRNRRSGSVSRRSAAAPAGKGRESPAVGHLASRDRP